MVEPLRADDNADAPTPSVETMDPGLEEQTPEQKELSRKIEELFQKARKERKSKESRWDQNFEFYLGRQWPYRRPSYRHSEVVNFCFAAIESIIPILTDNKPQISFIPEDQDDRDLAEAITKIADAEWSREGWSYVLADIVKVGVIYGTAIGAMEFDPNDNGGIGKIKFCNADIYSIYPAPRAKDINDGSCPYIIEAIPIPVEEAKAKFPDITDLIKGGGYTGIPSRYEQTNFDTSLNANAVRSNDAVDDLTSSYTALEGKKVDQCLQMKCWMQDETLEEVELDSNTRDTVQDPSSPQVPTNKVLRKKYPNGRYVIKVDDLIAFDGPNPYDDGKYPYARFIDYQIPHEFWGLGDIDQLKSPQKILNRLLSFMMDTIVLMGNPIWVTDLGAIDTDQVTNQPGLVVEKTPGSEVVREQGIGLPPGLMNIYETTMQAFDRIFGSGEITQGNAPGGVTAGIAIDSLQEAAQTRLRQKARNLEKFLNEIGTMYLSRVMQFYDTPRIITISDEASALNMKQFKFRIEKAPEPTGSSDQHYHAYVQEIQPDESGQSRPGDIKVFKTKGLFDVRSTIGSNLPFAKRAKADTAITLFKLGALPVDRLLHDLDYPNADKIVQELKDQQQAQAQAAAQAQQQKQPH